MNKGFTIGHAAVYPAPQIVVWPHLRVNMKSGRVLTRKSVKPKRAAKKAD